MAHYAFLDENNVVTNVFVGRDENDIVDGIADWENYYSAIVGQVCKRTSYNGKIRKQYAGIGSTYDEINDIFISPKPYPSWKLNNNFDWQAPKPYPTNGDNYAWDEATQTWVAV